MPFDKSISSIRLLKYPERKFELPDCAFEDGEVVCCGAHVDHVFITFLTTFDYPGTLSGSCMYSWPFVNFKACYLYVYVHSTDSRMNSL